MEKDPSGCIVIKKYANRRLYDTQSKRFVNTRELADMIRGGRDVTVIDKVTGEDITKVILTQVIMEEERGQQDVLSASFLHQLIRSTGSAYKSLLKDVLSTSAKTLQQARDQVESTLLKRPHREPSPPSTAKQDELEEIKARLAELESRLREMKSSEAE